MIALTFNNKLMSLSDKVLGYDQSPVTKYKRYMWYFEMSTANHSDVFQMGAIKINDIDLPYSYVNSYHNGGNELPEQPASNMIAAITGDDPNHKWCINQWYSWQVINRYGWLIFDLPSAVEPTSYSLQIAGDTSTYPNRNPQLVKLYASTAEPTTFDDASWVLLSEYSDSLPTANYSWYTVWEK